MGNKNSKKVKPVEPPLKEEPDRKQSVELEEKAIVDWKAIPPPSFGKLFRAGLPDENNPGLDWVAHLWQYLHQYTIKNSNIEISLFLADVVNLKHHYPNPSKNDEVEYVKANNRIYDSYVPQIHGDVQNKGGKVPHEVSMIKGVHAQQLANYKNAGWKNKDKLLSPGTIWEDAEGDTFANMAGIWSGFKQSEEYKEWSNSKYGKQYIDWNAKQSKAHLAYFNDMDMMNKQQEFVAFNGRIYDHLGHYKHESHPNYHQQGVTMYGGYNNYEYNMDLILLMGIMAFIFMFIYCVCAAAICAFNIFIGYIFCVKSESQTQSKLDELANDNV